MQRTLKPLSYFFVTSLALLAFVSLGCDTPDSSTSSSTSSSSHDDHDHGEDGHDHGHDHAHDHPAHGPNHGHIFDLDTEEYQGEWAKYKDNNVIRMFILDGGGKKNVPVKIDSFVIKPKVGEGDVSFEMKPEDADENGLTATYMLDDQDLSIAIPLGVDIEIKSGDKTWKGEIKAHKPLDH